MLLGQLVRRKLFLFCKVVSYLYNTSYSLLPLKKISNFIPFVSTFITIHKQSVVNFDSLLPPSARLKATEFIVGDMTRYLLSVAIYLENVQKIQMFAVLCRVCWHQFQCSTYIARLLRDLQQFAVWKCTVVHSGM